MKRSCLPPIISIHATFQLIILMSFYLCFSVRACIFLSSRNRTTSVVVNHQNLTFGVLNCEPIPRRFITWVYCLLIEVVAAWPLFLNTQNTFVLSLSIVQQGDHWSSTLEFLFALFLTIYQTSPLRAAFLVIALLLKLTSCAKQLTSHTIACAWWTTA